jgi:hypothetical protein
MYAYISCGTLFYLHIQWPFLFQMMHLAGTEALKTHESQTSQQLHERKKGLNPQLPAQISEQGKKL